MKIDSTNETKRGLAGLLSGLVITGAVFPLLLGCSESNARSTAAASAGPIPEVQVQKVAERSIPLRMEFTGQLVAAHQIEVKPRVSGYVVNAVMPEGSIVKAGEVLFEIDPRPFVAKHEEAQAEVARAKAAVELATQEFARAERLAQQQKGEPLPSRSPCLVEARVGFHPSPSKPKLRKSWEAEVGIGRIRGCFPCKTPNLPRKSS